MRRCLTRFLVELECAHCAAVQLLSCALARVLRCVDLSIDGCCRCIRYGMARCLCVEMHHSFSLVMTSEQAAQLIDDTLDLVHQRLQDLQASALDREHQALADEFREWRHPVGGHIDLMVFPGLA